MKLVKLSELSEEERQKVLEEQNARINNNRQASEQIRIDVNNKFNEYTSKKGTYDTTKHYTTIGDLKKAYKNNDSMKKSINTYYRNSEGSLWNKVMKIATSSAGRTNNSAYFMNNIRSTYKQSNKQQTIENEATQQYENLKKLGQIQNNVTNYQKNQEEALKSTLAYKQAKLQNPNATDDELLKITKNNSNELYANLIKDISSKNGIERKTELKNISTSNNNPFFYDKNKYRELNNNVLQYKISKEAQENANKINEDLKNGKIGSSVGHVLEALPTKAMEAVASPIYATGSLLNLKFPIGTADQDLKDWISISSKYDQTTGNIESGLVRSASNVSGTIGYMIPSILASAIAPETNLGRIAQAVSVSGQSYNETLNDDASNKMKALLTGVGKGTASYAIEGITGGNILGKGSLDDLAIKTIASKASNETSKKIASMIYEVGGEVFEEELENQVDYLVDKIVNDKGISLKEWLTEQSETVKSTIASTLVLKLLGLGGNIYKDVKEYEYNADTKKWINEAEKIIKKENLQIDVDKLNNSNNQNLPQNGTQNQLKIQDKQIIPIENKNTQNGNKKRINNIANNQKTLYNNIALGEVKNVPTEEILKFKTDGGYRDKQQMERLRKDIQENGIKNPIELFKNKDGSIEIENGNHRLQIAKELGIKELPVKFVESWNNIGINKADKQSIKKWENNYNENNKNRTEVNEYNEGTEFFKGSMDDNRNQLGNGRTAATNDRLFNRVQEYNDRTSSNSTFEKNNHGLEKSSSFNLPTKEDVQENILPTQGEKINWNEIERTEGKIRKHYRSIIESSNTTKEAKAIAKELMGTDTYVPETNKGQLAQADARINNSNPEIELKSLMNRVMQGEKVSSIDIAVGERLIQYYSKIGDKTNLQEAIQTTAMAGTSAGQTVQALAMLNHQTPQGQAIWIQRSVDKMNNELAKKKGGTITKDSEGNIKVINKMGKDITDKVDLFNLTPDMIEKVINSKDKQTMYKNIDSVYEELGSQVPKSTIEKIDSWRYFSMLANPRTHIRNMVGNVAMGKMQRVKDKLAGGIEDVVSTFNKDMERTKTLRIADYKTKKFAKNDVLNPDVQSMIELNKNKYNPQSRLQNARKTFKNDALNDTLGKLFDWNDKTLEAEDALGLKSAYKKALTDYLTANKIDTDKITDVQLSKARTYAVQQAKEATFHQANSIATAINQFSRKNRLTKGVTDAVLPFVKTPLNVAKSGLDYNPTGLLKTITVDTVKLRKGDITVNKYIDNLSKGLTGTGIAVLGYALADAGILKASGGDDDKKENYDEALGKQTYSITIGNKTYSLDWLAPAGIPLFVGAEAKALRNSQKEEKGSISSDDDKKFNQWLKSAENIANAMANSISPMSEMSMISGLTSALTSYEKDSTQMIGNILTNAGKSYVNQFVPTALGQIARTTDDYERSTTSTKTGLLSKAVDQTKLQMMSKIPGLRQKLPTKADIWGNEQKSETNIPLRVINNFINPATVKNIDTSKVDTELNNLYSKIGESTILPSTIEKTYTINNQVYRMTSDEYEKYKKEYGQTSYKLLDSLINSKDYSKLNDEQKQKAVENDYTYAKEKNKVDYAKNKDENLKTSTLYDTLEELKQKGGDQSAYLGYIAKTKDITGEGANKQKIGILANSNYSNNTKEIIYKNTEGSNDKKIILVDKLKLPINQYLKYKSQIFESDKDSDGETISGSKNKKLYNYLNSISDNELSQYYKKIICKIENINDYDNDIVNFINNSKQLSYNERTEILETIGFKIDKAGKIQTKSILPIYKYVK